MALHIYLPIAGHSISILVLFFLGIAAGILSGLFGIGGGFLLTPLLILIGIPTTVAAASDSNQIVAAATSGTYAHWRFGNVDFKMGILLLIGGFAGGTVGVQLIQFLRQIGEADFVIKVCYTVLLGTVGVYMLQESWRSLITHRRLKPLDQIGEDTFIARIERKFPLKIHFSVSSITISLFIPLIIGALVGILAAVMGLGGGFIMIPMMVYILRMPMHVAVGTNLFQELFSCINITFMQSFFNHTVDIVLVLILLMGSTLGAQIGARISRRLNADQLKIFLAVLILLVMTNILLALLLRPQLLLSLAEI
jgi:hypothetical protein